MTTTEPSAPGEDSGPAADPVRRTSFATNDADRGIAAMSELYTGLGMRPPTDASFEPRMAAGERARLLEGWRRAVRRVRG